METIFVPRRELSQFFKNVKVKYGRRDSQLPFNLHGRQPAGRFNGRITVSPSLRRDAAKFINYERNDRRYR